MRDQDCPAVLAYPVLHLNAGTARERRANLERVLARDVYGGSAHQKVTLGRMVERHKRDVGEASSFLFDWITQALADVGIPAPDLAEPAIRQDLERLSKAAVIQHFAGSPG